MNAPANIRRIDTTQLDAVDARQAEPKPFLTGPERVARFRFEVTQLTGGEVVELLGWLLDTGISDPCPDMPDDLLDAMMPLHEAFRASYDAMQAALEPAERDHCADLADHLYDTRRDDRMVAEWEAGA